MFADPFLFSGNFWKRHSIKTRNPNKNHFTGAAQDSTASFLKVVLLPPSSLHKQMGAPEKN